MQTIAEDKNIVASTQNSNQQNSITLSLPGMHSKETDPRNSTSLQELIQELTRKEHIRPGTQLRSTRKKVRSADPFVPLQLVGGPSICPLPPAAFPVKPLPDAAGLPSPEKIRLPAVPSRLWSASRCSALVRVRPPWRRQAASFTGSRLAAVVLALQLRL